MHATSCLLTAAIIIAQAPKTIDLERCRPGDKGVMPKADYRLGGQYKGTLKINVFIQGKQSKTHPQIFIDNHVFRGRGSREKLKRLAGQHVEVIGIRAFGKLTVLTIRLRL